MEKKKVFCIAVALVILVGIIITAIYGFNVDMPYVAHKQVDIYIGKEFENDDIKKIVQEVMENKKVDIEKVEIYEDMVSINVKDITQEQLEQINQKLNEKYELENKTEDLEIISVPKVKLSTQVKPYIMPVAISSILILGYAVLRYRKLNIVKVLGKLIGISVLAQAIYFSIYAIVRTPFNRFTIPGAMMLAILVLFILFYQLENKKEKKEIENKKK